MAFQFLPLTGVKKESFEKVKRFLEGRRLKEFKKLLKQGLVAVKDSFYGSERLGVVEEHPFIEPLTDNPEVRDAVDYWNEEILGRVRSVVFKSFAPNAESLANLIAPTIHGLEAVKEAVLLQLFSSEKIHILLLGDPATGKSEILRSAADLALKSSYGLGSGTSNAGLTVSKKGNSLFYGLLPAAHQGLCCIDELNLLKEKDRAGLLNAMEKGFVTYDKAGSHLRVDADVKVLAAANPKGDRFAGWMVETLKKQLPFDPALLSRFHLVFLVRRPGVKGFVNIAKRIVSGKAQGLSKEESSFVKDYQRFVEHLNPAFEKKHEALVTRFAERVKRDEEKFLVEVSPRIIVGVVRLAKARARLLMREKVSKEDVLKAISIVENSLYYRLGKKKKLKSF